MDRWAAASVAGDEAYGHYRLQEDYCHRQYLSSYCLYLPDFFVYSAGMSWGRDDLTSTWCTGVLLPSGGAAVPYPFLLCFEHSVLLNWNTSLFYAYGSCCGRMAVTRSFVERYYCCHGCWHCRDYLWADGPKHGDCHGCECCIYCPLKPCFQDLN